MNSKLIPTAILDRNGKQTTVHKKDGSLAASSKVLAGIAPSLGGNQAASKRSVGKPFKPLAKQSESKFRTPTLYASMIHASLLKLLECKFEDYDSGFSMYRRSQPRFKISDMEGYDVLSAVDGYQNGLALLSLGITSADEAREFLEENRLQSIIADNSEMTSGALHRRVSMEAFIDFKGRTAADDHPETFLDALEAFSHKPVEKIHGLVTDVSLGKISLQDIKDVGITTISKMDNPYVLPDLLKEIHAGEADFTAKQLGTILNTAKGDYFAQHTMLTMMKDCGGEVAASIRNVDIIGNMQTLCKKDKLSKEETYAAVIYANEFHGRGYMHHSFIYELYRAGVPAEFAIEHNQPDNRFNVREIIGLHQGTAAAVVDGWL